MSAINARERLAILRSLAAGVVPAIGLQHIQVGRTHEVEAILGDLEQVKAGASTTRFVVGRFGSGKTFFLSLVRHVALQRKFVVVQADITTDRRLHGSDGQARALYTELMRNMATKSKPEGGALSNLVENWIGSVDHQVRLGGGSTEDVTRVLASALKPLQELVSGFDFLTVVSKYYQAFLNQNQTQQDHALRWLRGEYTTKTEARQDLGVRTIIEDDSVYDVLKLWAAFVRIAGYTGLVVNIDELVVLSERLNNSTARNNNYEAILRIVNDCLQGSVQGLAFLFAGTTDSIEDQRRGLFSYEALATRLATNRFATSSHRDMSGPLIYLDSLSPEDCHVLCENILRVFGHGDLSRAPLPEDGIQRYLGECQHRMGASYYLTPRDTIKGFVGLLQVLEQNPSADWRKLISAKESGESPSDPPKSPGTSDLKGFRL